MGISNEIHVQVASILLAVCFDDIDLVKRNVNGQEIPGKSSFLIARVSGKFQDAIAWAVDTKVGRWSLGSFDESVVEIA